MSKAIITEQHLHDIADAIIAKGGATAPMTPAQMPGAIAAIPTGGTSRPWWMDEDWPDIRELLEQDTHTSINKVAYLVDTWAVTGTNLVILSGGAAQAIYASNGQHSENSDRLNLDWSDNVGRYGWLIVCSNNVIAQHSSYRLIGRVWTHIDGEANCADDLKESLVVSGECDASSVTSFANFMYGTNRTTRSVDELELTGISQDFISWQRFGPKHGAHGLPKGIEKIRSSNCWYLFTEAYDLEEIPDIETTEDCDMTNAFGGLYSLRRFPLIKCHKSFSFSNSQFVYDRDSLARFDTNGNVIEGEGGGLVGNINTCANSGQVITFSSSTKALFTADQWTAIKTALAAKNWGCSPA